jgi:TrmH family RNA methyltransferase
MVSLRGDAAASPKAEAADKYNPSVEQVTSRNNAVVKRFRTVGREGRVGDTVLLDGGHLIEEALNSAIELSVVAFSDVAAVREAELLRRCTRSAVRVLTAPRTVLEAMSPVRHASGVVALAHVKTPDVAAAVMARPPQLILVLDSVQDPGNVGAAVRAAEAMGGTAVIAGRGTADPLGWKALRGSMGSAFRLPVTAASDMHDAMAIIRRAGIRTFATVPRGGTPLHRAALSGPSAVLLGGEGSGLSDELTRDSDERLTIEMRPPVESLNVSLAAALVLYEASRQRSNVAVR